MTTYLPPEVQAGLDDARKRALKKSQRLSVQAGEETFRVLEAWDDGFALELAVADHLRGMVDLYDGPTLVSQCLIVASEEDGNQMRFEYKRMTEATGEQPVDFEKPENAPVALIGKG
ncbi:hypothetical protein [Roseovarius indicus]|uniref:hypothetical protein n=1 Tax=Roseovarius indicus TaxID=540747 RepID=UPI0032EC62AC